MHRICVVPVWPACHPSRTHSHLHSPESNPGLQSGSGLWFSVCQEITFSAIHHPRLGGRGGKGGGGEQGEGGKGRWRKKVSSQQESNKTVYFIGLPYWSVSALNPFEPSHYKRLHILSVQKKPTQWRIKENIPEDFGLCFSSFELLGTHSDFCLFPLTA